jgi:hypothetical protein
VTAPAGSNATTIADSAVTLAKMAQVAAGRVLGRVTAGTGLVEALTGTQLTALLDAFTDALKGLVPASGGGTANFLRADGSWAAPPDTDTTYDAFTGDSGAGGAQGLVPAPSAGDAAAGKYLDADGTWTTPPNAVADGDKGDITVSSGGTNWQIDAGAVGDAEIRNSAALSVIGRAANSVGVPADVSATAGQYGHLTERGSALVFQRRSFQALTLSGSPPTATLAPATSPNALVTNSNDGTGEGGPIPTVVNVSSPVNGEGGEVVVVNSIADAQPPTWHLNGAATAVEVVPSTIPYDRADGGINVYRWVYGADATLHVWQAASTSAPENGPGSYVPTGANVANVADITPGTFKYMRMGSIVSFSGYVQLETTAPATLTEFSISLPPGLESAFSTTEDASGVLTAWVGTTIAGQVFADSAGDLIQGLFLCTAADVYEVYVTGHYEVL